MQEKKRSVTWSELIAALLFLAVVAGIGQAAEAFTAPKVEARVEQTQAVSDDEYVDDAVGHVSEDVFVGVVTSDVDFGGSVRFDVDDVEVTLDLVFELDDCGGGPPEQVKQAVRDRLAPGTPVLVVRTEPGGLDVGGFVHLLSDGVLDPETVGSLPTDVEDYSRDARDLLDDLLDRHEGDDAGGETFEEASVNEVLVSTGWWVPSFDGLDSPQYNPVSLTDLLDSDVGDWATPYVISASPDLTAEQAAYAPRLVAAANLAQQQRVGLHGPCFANVAAQIEWAEEYEAEREAEEERREREERNRPPQYCIDGDGDGVCNE